jgi:hypothetical protein
VSDGQCNVSEHPMRLNNLAETLHSPSRRDVHIQRGVQRRRNVENSASRVALARGWWQSIPNLAHISISSLCCEGVKHQNLKNMPDRKANGHMRVCCVAKKKPCIHKWCASSRPSSLTSPVLSPFGQVQYDAGEESELWKREWLQPNSIRIRSVSIDDVAKLAPDQEILVYGECLASFP